MGSPVAQFMLESMAAPFILAGLILIAARRFDCSLSVMGIAEACTLILALAVTYLFAFGLPVDLVFSARMKILLAALGGLVVGIAAEHRARWAGGSLIAGMIGVPIWVGLPALLQGRPESAFLALPVAAALIAPFLIHQASARTRTSRILIALTLSFSLAAIAIFGKAFSFAELSLSLGSALMAVWAFSRQQLATPAAVTAAAASLALLTALLLYSEANPLALCILVTIVGAERLASLVGGDNGTKVTTLLTLVFCALPAALAILIARIDAGPFSLY